MPRKSRTQPAEVPEGERRVTRRSLRSAATPDKPEKPAARAKASPSPSPAPRGRARGRSAGGRGKKGKKEEEEEPEEKEETATEDAQEETESKEDSEAGAGDAVEKKPARGRGRAKGKAATPKKKAPTEKEEEKSEEPSEEKEENKEAPSEEKEENKDESQEEKAAEAKEETVTPRKGRGRRSAGASPAKAETPPSSGRSSRTRSPRKLPEETPTRRSGRTRKSAETTPKKDEEEMEESETTGQKRKREDDEPAEVAEKKQKTEETEPAAPQKEETEPAVPQKEEQAMEVEEPKTEAPKQAEETPSAAKEPEKVEAGEETKEPEAPTTKEPEAPTVSDEKVEPANYPPADEPEKAAVTQPEESEAMDTTPAVEEPPTEKAPEAVVEKETEPDMNEYVMVSKDEIPPADSAEVADALPKEPEPVKEAEEQPNKEPEEPAPPLEPSAPPASAPDENPAIPEVEPTSQPVSVIQEPVSSQPEPPTENGENGGECAVNASMNTSDAPEAEPPKDMAAPSNNIDSVAQEPSATIPDPLFQRQYVANPNIDSTLAADLARKFSVVSYNILADCHAPLSKYPWITPDHLSQEYRHKKLLQELQYLDADIVCLQEVGPEYYENTLKPTLGALGYEGSYMKRVDDNINEGEATFVRSRRFTVLSQKGIALRDLAFKELGNSGLENENLDAVKRFVDKPSVVLITQLRCNNTGNTVTIGNIHVSWEQLAKPDLQCIEVADALKELVATATPQGAFLICGDFNSWPGSPVYQLTKEGYLSDQSMSELQGVNNVRMADGSLSPLINLWWKGFQHTATNMKSAYNQVLGNEPHTTRYPHNGWVKQVDFVWYSGNTLETGGVLQTVQQDQLASGIPNASFPSDHISLKTDLVFKL